MKKVFLLAFASAVGAVQAADSPEVLFVGNETTGGIQRFDPISGASFGSFGVGIITQPIGLAVDNTGTVYVSDRVSTQSVIRVFNGFTGNYLGQLGAARTDFIAGLEIGPDGYLYGATTPNSVGAAGGIMKMNRTTGATSNLAIPGSTNPTDVAYAATGVIYVSATNKSFAVNAASFTNVTSYTTITGATFIHFDQNRQGWYQGGTGAQWGIGTPRPGIYNFAGGLIANSSGTQVTDMANGHSLMYAGIRDGAGNEKIQRYDPKNNVFLGTFGGQTGFSYGPMACYTAPEPGSIVALGAGAALLVIRRRGKGK